MKIRIKNWEQFQHFKDRCPPWIKLYKDLLNDPDWHDLNGDLAKTLVMLWLVASEDCDKEGRLPDPRRLAFRLHMDESTLLKRLQALSHWLIQDDINMISSRYQDDTPETEGETEKEYCATNGRTSLTDLSDEQLDSDKPDEGSSNSNGNDEPLYETKKGRKLKGQTLLAFEEFWDVFEDKRSKAEAADAFLGVYSHNLHDDIIAGARRYATLRPSLVAKGQTAKMAQGWLTSRRWKDEISLPPVTETSAYMQGVDA